VDRRQNGYPQRRVEDPASALSHLERRPHHRLRRGGTEQDQQARSHDLDLRDEPGSACAHVHLARLAVEPALAAPLKSEVFDHVREIDLRSRDARRLQGFVEDAAGRTNERVAFDVLSIAGLLADHHQPRPLASLAEHRLRCCLPKLARFASNRRFTQRLQRRLPGDQGLRRAVRVVI
jgi:hypothetical protein